MKKHLEVESDSNLTTDSNSNSHPLKHSDSVSTLHGSHSDLSLIQDRYRTLEQDYSILQQQHTKKKTLYHQQQQ